MIKPWRLLKIILVCLFIFLWSSPSYALNIEDVINPRQTYGGWVIDMASILKDETESHLNKIISQLESKNGVEIAVVTVLETSPEASPKAFATKLFNRWEIGKVEENNGILFLISVNEHRVEIETGLGIEPVLSNSQITEIIEQDITPLFKQQEFDLGVLIVVDDLIAEFSLKDNSETRSKLYSFEYIKAFMLLGLFFLVGLVSIKIDKIRSKNRINNSNHYTPDNNITCNSSNLIDSINTSFADSSFTSGSDFGGGSSDGGGDGGSW